MAEENTDDPTPEEQALAAEGLTLGRMRTAAARAAYERQIEAEAAERGLTVEEYRRQIMAERGRQSAIARRRRRFQRLVERAMTARGGGDCE